MQIKIIHVFGQIEREIEQGGGSRVARKILISANFAPAYTYLLKNIKDSLQKKGENAKYTYCICRKESSKVKEEGMLKSK